MTIPSMLFQLILEPLILVFDTIYSSACTITRNLGLSIIFLSLAINLLVLPLYRRADAIQEEERRVSLRLQPGIDHIKQAFKGDERFMMLQTYYRQNNYRPYYVLRGSLSLLLEIPFFIAAYRFLSGLSILQGIPFGPIRDLSLPDGLLHVAGMSVNVLPILMTAINIVSGAIYTRGMPLRSKIQLYGMALVFLVLLYDSPSALVFYWTLNNVFSLVKNIFYKLRKPKLVFCALCTLMGFGCLYFAMTHRTAKFTPYVYAIAVAMQLPLILYFLLRNRKPAAVRYSRGDDVVFVLSGVFLTILMGALIPSAVISSSPMEFMDIGNLHSPMTYVLNATLIAAGTFLVWGNVYYRLANPASRRRFAYCLMAIAGIAVVDFMFFGKNYGDMSSLLEYDKKLKIYKSGILKNCCAIVGVAAATYVIWKKKGALARAILAAGCVALAVVSVTNFSVINADYRTLAEAVAAGTAQEEASIPLSKNGKNVIVLMMDRAFNRFFPYLLEERPELQRQFAGFTYYPDTLSYGNCTVVGSPALYGGYEYTPLRIDARTDERLVDKHDEALKVMPVAFLNAGFDVTVCDPTYAGYKGVPDLSIYDDYPAIRRYITIGNYKLEEFEMSEKEEAARNRNFFCYSVFRSAPLAIHRPLYDNGKYRETDANFYMRQKALSISTATGLRKEFISSYAVLKSLAGMTDVRDENKNTFLMMSNDLTHEQTILQTPDYVPAIKVDNREYDEEHAVRRSITGEEFSIQTEYQMAHYHSNMAAMIQLGNWFDYLREQGVYDNTRIIIVADHGRNLGLFDMQLDSRQSSDIGYYNPLLLFKDFDSQEFTIDDTFMTNADTPTLAMAGLIDNPVNPFTGKAITNAAKDDPRQYVAYTVLWNPKKHKGSQYSSIRWMATGHDVFNMDDWEVLDGEPAEQPADQAP